MIISLILTFAEISVIGVQYPIIILKMFSILFKTLISRCGTYSLLALNKLNRTNIIKNWEYSLLNENKVQFDNEFSKNSKIKKNKLFEYQVDSDYESQSYLVLS